MVRRFGGAVAATVCSLGFLYVSVIQWVTWSNPPFDLSAMDGELIVSERQHDGSLLWPISLSVLTILAVALAVVSWVRSKEGQPRGSR